MVMQVVDATPFKRDTFGELAKAFRDAGLRAGLYVNPAQLNRDDYIYRKRAFVWQNGFISSLATQTYFQRRRHNHDAPSHTHTHTHLHTYTQMNMYTADHRSSLGPVCAPNYDPNADDASRRRWANYSAYYRSLLVETAERYVVFRQFCFARFFWMMTMAEP